MPGVPKSILSGGRYDRLLEKFGKKQQAAGFAVYLNLLDEYKPFDAEYDFDNLIIYGNSKDLKKVYALSEELIKKGETVRVQRENTGGLRVRNIINLCGGGNENE